ncbi:VOC family protein [Chloroflexota bacterium]
MFLGVNNVGIGVSDMDKAIKWYGEVLTFTEVMFDYNGVLPGMEKVTGKPETKARVVMLKNQNSGPLGLGMIKLVQLLPPDKPEPCTVGDTTIWGDIGIAEVCFNVHPSVQLIFAQLMEKGLRSCVTPASGTFPPYDTVANYAYMRDPDNGLLEFIDWCVCKTLGTQPAIEGVNHVGFGVADMERSLEFYGHLGFNELIFDQKDTDVYVMSTLFPPNPPRIRCPIYANYHGAWVEPIQLLPPYKPTPFKKAWGHLGAMEFAIGVTNIEKAYEELQKKGIRFHSQPQIVECTSGQWKYAYVVEPDNLYVSLIEQRF